MAKYAVMESVEPSGSAKQLAAQVRQHCAKKYAELFGRPWSTEAAQRSRDRLGRWNEKERGAHAALDALSRAVRQLQEFFNAYDSTSSMGPKELGGVFAVEAFVIQPHLRPLIAWVEGRRASPKWLWQDRMAVVLLHDKEYSPDVLKLRSSARAAVHRLTDTELAWISLLFGNFPSVRRQESNISEVIALEAKHVADARKRLSRRLDPYRRPPSGPA
jgi:hypothetical protein